MASETPRELALAALNGLARRPDPDLLHKVFRLNPHLEARDRAFVSHLVQGVLRWKLRLDHIIAQSANLPLKNIKPSVRNILRLALFQIFFLERVPESAAVNEAVNQARRKHSPRTAAFVNAVLRNSCRHKHEISLPDRKMTPIHFLSVFYSYPRWLIQMWIKEWGMAFTERLLEAGNRIPPVILRANTLKIERDDLIGFLAAEGVEGKALPYSPEGVRLAGFKGKIDGLPGFPEGFFQVQDEAAQITAHLLRPAPGENVLDMCAGLGGKTTHLAALMEDRGRVVALDNTVGRLIHLTENQRRLGIGNIFSLAADASRSPSSLFRIRFGKILIDAPCSGLGVLSRHPDGKWNRREKDIRRLALIQQRLIHEAASLVRKGGEILYVTCTLSRWENEDAVRHCLKKRPDLMRVDLRERVPSWGKELIDEHGFFRTFPHVHDMDGFFAALLKKR
jgi:16S rRNA (cytosine967-C5)-methyltransferase